MILQSVSKVYRILLGAKRRSVSVGTYGTGRSFSDAGYAWDNCDGRSAHWYTAMILVPGMIVGLVSCDDRCSQKVPKRPVVYAGVFVGGGTAGCLSAYLYAKWLQRAGIEGKVLLIERGPAYSINGPDPKLESWFDNWGTFGEAHSSIRDDGSSYPVAGSDHRGLGGCGTHDTRITFQPTDKKKCSLAKAMGWSQKKLDVYIQAALNMMPLTRSIIKPEPFYKDVISTLTAPDHKSPPLRRLKEDQFESKIVVDSVAENTLAMYSDETRWTSALLLEPEIRPSNLEVLTNYTADKVVLERGVNDQVRATGVVIIGSDGIEHVINSDLIAITSGAFGAPAILQRSGIGPRQLLSSLGIETVVDNGSVGHGIDHPEIGLLYAWNEKLELPRGGAMGWPLSLFLSIPPDMDSRNNFVQCHFGAGSAEPYTENPALVCTPSCTEPDRRAGYHIRIVSKDPHTSSEIVHADQRADLEVLYRGLVRASEVCEKLRLKGLCGDRISPVGSLDFTNKDRILDWIRENHFTVYHWACTCKAGVNGSVCDEKFRVRNISSRSQGDIVANLYVGSAASLPDLSEANPHLLISAFSFALAESMYKESSRRNGNSIKEPREIHIAREKLLRNDGQLSTVASGEEVPKLINIAAAHATSWREHNKNKK